MENLGQSLRVLNCGWYRRTAFAMSESRYQGWIILAPVDGLFRYEVASQSGECSFGELIVCPPGMMLRREMLSEWLTFVVAEFEWDGDTPEKSLPVGKRIVRETTRLATTYAAFRAEGEYHASWRSHLVQDLLFLSCAWNGRDAQTPPDRLMEQAARQIADSAFCSINFQILAAEMALSPVQFTRRFKSALGLTPKRYLTQIRLREVCRLLTETDHTLAHIAMACGYGDEFYLSRVFFQNMRLRPSQYRSRYTL